MDLLAPVHALAAELPDDETFGLASQLRRAAECVPAYIADGYAKHRPAKEFRVDLMTAMGSAGEVVVHPRSVKDLGYASAGECDGGALIHEYAVFGRRTHTLLLRWRTLSDASSAFSAEPPGGR